MGSLKLILINFNSRTEIKPSFKNNNNKKKKV